MKVTTMGRHGRGGLLLSLLLAMAGCGPGVGGTGTGDGFALDLFGARAASVCSASFASELKCPSRIVVVPWKVPDSDGSETVLWVDDPAEASVTARISASLVEFVGVCEGLRFEGTWGEIPEQGGRFFGFFTVTGVDTALPGSLAVVSNGDALSFVLSDVDGKQLFGPLALKRSDAAPTLAVCPSGSSSPQSVSTFR
jgi:hypothetical protein